ncbi:MAG: flagellar hook-basal body complex protein FliE [Rhodobacteraceae bacterium]|nr:flagellar hook-basal body complex protein FliE [Paracoccaceae bacterium]
MSTSAVANNAYQMAARLARQVDDNAEEVATRGGVNFGELVKSSFDNVVDQGNSMEAKSLSMVDGKTNVVDVVTAIAETEVALETMVSVRDRVISAYEEIMRMPI